MNRTGSKNISLILAASFFYMAGSMLVTPLIVGFSAQSGASATLAGTIGGLMNLCSLFCRPAVGNLADRVSKYRLSMIGAGMMALACVGYMLAQRAWVIVLARIANGLGFACCSVCMSTWMSSLLPKEKIGSGMGLYGTMNALAMAVAPAAGVRVYQLAGYRTAFGIALACAVLTGVIIQFVSDRGLPERSAVRTRPQLADRRVLPISLIIMLFAIPYCATQSYLISYTQARQLSVSVSLFFPFYAAVLLTLRLSLRRLFDRLPFRRFLFAGAASALAAIVLLSEMKSNALLLLAAAFMAGGYGVMCSVCQSTAIVLAGKEHRGLANSTYYIGLDLGMTLGPFLGGLLYGRADIRLFYPALLLTVPAALLVYFLSRRASRL